MHNGFVRVDNEKMSKSLGNFFTVREILKQYDSEVVRFFITRAHYRSPLNYSDQHLDDAKHALTRLYTALKGDPVTAGAIDWNNAYAQCFRDAMNDDFNTPEAVAVLFDLANELNRSHEPRLAGLLKSLGGVLGLLQRDPTDFLQGRRDVVVKPSGVSARGETGTVSVITMSEDEIKQKIDLRTDARRAKNFEEADRIRDELLDSGVVLEDTAQGTTWRRS